MAGVWGEVGRLSGHDSQSIGGKDFFSCELGRQNRGLSRPGNYSEKGHG
jgi:hypothetical protein